MLAGSRKEVVVKVLRPGTEDVLLTDLNFVSLQHKQRARRAQVASPARSAEFCSGQPAFGWPLGRLPATSRCLHALPACSFACCQQPQGFSSCFPCFWLLDTHLPSLTDICKLSCTQNLPAQLYLVTRFLEFIQPDLGRLSLGGILSDIRTSMMDEVDFTKVCLTRWLHVGLCVLVKGGGLCVGGGP